MAYEGEITYMDIPFGGVEWSNAVHLSGEHVLRAPVRAFSHCKVELEGPQRAILDEKVEKRGWLIYDEENRRDIQSLLYIHIGRGISELGRGEEQECYVLAVKQIREGRFRRADERIGVGSVQQRLMLSKGGKPEVRTI
jgi:hypothetical protein